MALASVFLTFVEYSKYITLFILYIFAFKYLFYEKTVFASFLLFLILHTLFLFLFFYDYNKIKQGLGSLTEWVTTLSLLGGGSWLGLFIGLIIIVVLFQKLNHYSTKYNEPIHLGKSQKKDLFILKILAIIISVSLSLICISLQFSEIFISTAVATGKINEPIKIAYIFIAILFFVSVFMYLKMIKLTDYGTLSMCGMLFLAIIYIVLNNLSGKTPFLLSISAISLRSLILIFGAILYFFIFHDSNILFVIVPLALSILFGLFVSFNETGNGNGNGTFAKPIVLSFFGLLFALSVFYLVKSVLFFRQFQIISRA